MNIHWNKTAVDQWAAIAHFSDGNVIPCAVERLIVAGTEIFVPRTHGRALWEPDGSRNGRLMRHNTLEAAMLAAEEFAERWNKAMRSA